MVLVEAEAPGEAAVSRRQVAGLLGELWSRRAGCCSAITAERSASASSTVCMTWSTSNWARACVRPMILRISGMRSRGRAGMLGARRRPGPEMPRFTATASLYASTTQYGPFSPSVGGAGPVSGRAGAGMRFTHSVTVGAVPGMPGNPPGLSAPTVAVGPGDIYGRPCDDAAILACVNERYVEYQKCIAGALPYPGPGPQHGIRGPLQGAPSNGPHSSAWCEEILQSIKLCNSEGCPGGMSCMANDEYGTLAGSVCCPEGTRNCGGWCADLSSDRGNCGRCREDCLASGRVDPECCRGRCTDLYWDSVNCGGCGNGCEDDEECWMGNCECTDDDTRCGGTCTDLEADEDNCGGCGVVCRTGEKCCAGKCTNLQGDITNCGTCGNQCLYGEIYGSCCAGQCIWTGDDENCGKCGVVCAPGEECCANLVAGEWRWPPGLCKNLEIDGNNCGRCGKACPSGEDCCGGKCTNSTDYATDGDNCGKCGKVCASNEACCAGHCTNLETDRNNCKECGKPCLRGEECCGGHCVNLATDVNNCKECGTTCSRGEECYKSACVCVAGYARCDDKTCTDLETDGNNCGGCGRPCLYIVNVESAQRQQGIVSGMGACGGGRCVCPSNWVVAAIRGDGDQICCPPDFPNSSLGGTQCTQ
jgi:hypothetical protein